MPEGLLPGEDPIEAVIRQHYGRGSVSGLEVEVERAKWTKLNRSVGFKGGAEPSEEGRDLIRSLARRAVGGRTDYVGKYPNRQNLFDELAQALDAEETRRVAHFGARDSQFALTPNYFPHLFSDVPVKLPRQGGLIKAHGPA
jgi:hypothetical protein